MKRSFVLTVICVVFFIAQAMAAEYYGIIYSFGKKARNAYLDVSLDTSVATGPVDVLFRVSNSRGVPLSEFNVLTNSNGFASTSAAGNLFNLLTGEPMLIYARTVYAVTSAATLHVDSMGAPLTVGLLPLRNGSDFPLGMGDTFAIATGNFRSATLLIANISGSDQELDIFKGTQGAINFGIYTNPRLTDDAIWKVDLSQNEAMSNLIVKSTGLCIVQFVVDDGHGLQSFQVMPRH